MDVARRGRAAQRRRSVATAIGMAGPHEEASREELSGNRGATEVGSRLGDGNVLPSPPTCLHECGGFRGTRVESSGIDEDVERRSHPQSDQKSANLNDFRNRRGIGANPGASKIYRGASPLELPYTRSRSPLRRLAPIAWLVRCAHSRPVRPLRRERAVPCASSITPQVSGGGVQQMNCRVECLGLRCMWRCVVPRS